MKIKPTLALWEKSQLPPHPPSPTLSPSTSPKRQSQEINSLHARKHGTLDTTGEGAAAATTPVVGVDEKALSPASSVFHATGTGAVRDISDIDRRLGELHDFLRRAKAGGGGAGAGVPLPFPLPPPVAGSRPANSTAGNEDPETQQPVSPTQREQNTAPLLPPPPPSRSFEAAAGGPVEFSSGSMSVAVGDEEGDDGAEDGSGGGGGSLVSGAHDGEEEYIGDRNSEGDGVLWGGGEEEE